VKDFVAHIKPQIQCSNTWYNLGVLLDVPEKKLNDIRLSEQDDLDLCSVKMFLEWLDDGTDVSWSTLLQANYFLNSKIEKLRGKGTVVMHTLHNYAVVLSV